MNSTYIIRCVSYINSATATEDIRAYVFKYVALK